MRTVDLQRLAEELRYMGKRTDKLIIKSREVVIVEETGNVKKERSRVNRRYD